MKKRLLTWVPGDFIGGAEDYAVRVSEEALDREWDHLLLTTNSNCAAQIRRENPRLTVIESKAKPATDSSRYRILSAAKRLLKTLSLSKEILFLQPSVIHAVLPWHAHSSCFLSACRLTNIPTLATFQLVVEGYPPSDFDLMAIKSFGSPKHILSTISSNNTRLLAGYYAIDPSDIVCIPNRPRARQISSFNENIPKQRTEMRDRYGLPLDKKLILTVGGLRHQKGHDLIVDIATNFCLDHPDCAFVFAGDGEDKESLQKRITDLGLSDKFFILGHCERVSELYFVCDLFLFPSRFEGESFALLEAADMKIPIVSSNASGIAETFRHGLDAVIFETENKEDMAMKLDYAISNLDVMTSLALSASRRINEYTESDMMEETFAIFDRLVKQGR